MPMITAINPRKKKPRKSGKKKGAPKMAKKKKRKAATKTIVKYRTRKNPSVKKYARKAGGYAKQTLLGINVTGAMKSTIPLVLGALACKFTAKKFTDGGEYGEDWGWKNYAFGLLGGFVASFAAKSLFKTSNSTSQKILEGAFLLTAYNMLQNEFFPTNPSLEEWFGEEDEESLPDYSGAYGADMGPGDFAPQAEGVMGDIWQGEDIDYVQGEDGAWRPIDEGHRDVSGMGADDMLRPVTPQMGDDDDMLRPVTPQMGTDFDPENRMYSEF